MYINNLGGLETMERLRVPELKLICHEVRRRILKTVLNAGSGHLGGCLSSVELMVALYFGGILKFDVLDPRNPYRDRVLIRGHLGPLRYSIFSLLGWVSGSELTTYRSFGSKLQGHESMDSVPGVDITPSGSLGMILSYGVGCSFALLKQKLDSTVYVFLGDGEEQEGNISEAARHASHLNPTNLVCILDRNLKQLSHPTKEVDSNTNVRKVWEGYGWDVKEIEDGHSIGEIIDVFQESREFRSPRLIVANTVKGYGLRNASSHFCGYHTISTCPKAYVIEAINEQKEQIEVAQAEIGTIGEVVKSRLAVIPKLPTTYKYEGKQLDVSIELGAVDHFDDVLVSYCKELVALFAKNRDFRFYVMTADWIPGALFTASHFHMEHVIYLDVGIREQHLFAMAHGISISDPMSRILIIDGDFLIYRASDQLQVIAQANSKMIIVGTDSGLCEDRNGPTHQSTGQPGMLINMSNIVTLEPADAVDLNNCLNWAFTDYSAPVYLRLHSSTVNRLPTNIRNIRSYIVYQPRSPCRIILVGSGLPIDSILKLATRLDSSGFGAKVINAIGIGHLDRFFVDLLEEDIPVLTVYNGNENVLQSAVAKAVLECKKPRPSLILGHGFNLGTTGKLEDLLKEFNFDTDGLEKVIKYKFPHLDF